MLHEVHGRPQLHLPKAEDAGPSKVITIGTSFQYVDECEVECYDHATAIVASKELAAIRKEVAKEEPNPKLVEGTKEVIIDPSGSKSKAVSIGTTLSSE